MSELCSAKPGWDAGLISAIIVSYNLSVKAWNACVDVCSQFLASWWLKEIWTIAILSVMWQLNLPNTRGSKKFLGKVLVSCLLEVFPNLPKHILSSPVLQVGLTFLTDHRGRVMKRKGTKQVTLQDCSANKEEPWICSSHSSSQFYETFSGYCRFLIGNFNKHILEKQLLLFNLRSLLLF